MPQPDEPAVDSMFEAALVAIDVPLIIHRSDKILYANDAAARALRAPSPGALIGLDVSSIVHPDGLEAGHERRRLVLERGQVLSGLPVKLRALDGTTLYASVEAKRIAWAGEAAILVVATLVTPE